MGRGRGREGGRLVSYSENGRLQMWIGLQKKYVLASSVWEVLSGMGGVHETVLSIRPCSMGMRRGLVLSP